MFIHGQGINHPMDTIVSTSDCNAGVLRLLIRLVARKRSVSGVSTPVARAEIARAAGIAPGTVENILRRRLKDMGSTARDKLIAYAIADTQREIACLEHELLLARTLADRFDAPAVFAAQAALAQARELLEGR